MAKVDLSRVPEFYHNYIRQAKAESIQDGFQSHGHEAIALLKSIPTEKWDFSYGEGKWTIKEVVQHIIDAERVFAYRALRFSRKDKTPLASFDENLYARTAEAARRKPQDLLDELSAVERSSALLFQSFDQEQLNQEGEASGKKIYVEGIGFIILGHTQHHINIIKDRYLK